MNFLKPFFLVLFAAGLTFSQIQIGLGAGYGIAAGGEVYSNSTVDATGTQTKVDHKYGGLGNGLKIDLDAAYFLSDNFGIMLATGYALMGGYTEEDKSPAGTTEEVSTGSYLPINIGVKVKTAGADGGLYAYMAPGLYLPSAKMEDKQPTYTDEMTAKFDMGFGVSSGMGVIFAVSEALGIKVELNSTYAFAKIKEFEMKDGLTGTTATFKVVNDKTASSLAADEVSGKENINFSSINLKVGAVMAF